MYIKKQRLSVIETILRTEVIRSQDDLQKSLMDKGFETTQSTLSRDLKRLKLVKAIDPEGRYKYVLPDADFKKPPLPTKLFDDITIEFSGTLAVIKTRSGYAMGIASDIDNYASGEILGTIAGDDTILVIPREGFTQVQIKESLVRILIDKELSNKI